MAVPLRSTLPVLPEHSTSCGRPPERGSRRRAWVLIAVHVAIALHVVHWKLAGRTLTPLEPSEAGETLTTGAINAGFVLLVLLLASTLVLGRFFCGWACHVVALQDASAWLLKRLGVRPQPVRSRLLAFVPLFAALWMFVLPSVFQWLEGRLPSSWRWHLLTEDFWTRFPGPWMAILTFLVTGFLCVWVLGAKGFCTYGCPYGALFSAAERFAPGRIRVNDDCEQCGHCTAVCTSNVRVHEEVARFGAVVDPGCMKCLDCVRSCPKDALSFAFAQRSSRTFPSSTPLRRGVRRTWDFTWAEELCGAVVFVAALYAFRGLYGLVPFLLAIALGVLASAATVVLWRLATLKDVRVQGRELKRSGRITGRGGGVWVASLGFLALAAHSGFVQAHARSGDGVLGSVAGLERGSVARAEALAESRRHLEVVERWGLVESADLHNKLGQIAYEERRAEDARRHLEQALELDPEIRSARVYLADLGLVRGDLQASLGYLEELLARDPSDPLVVPRLRAILARTPNDPRALALAERVVEERSPSTEQ